MTIAVKAARGLTYKAAAAVECFSGDTAMKIATEAVQIFGAQGFSPEYPIARYFQVAKGLLIIEGINQI